MWGLDRSELLFGISYVLGLCLVTVLLCTGVLALSRLGPRHSIAPTATGRPCLSTNVEDHAK